MACQQNFFSPNNKEEFWTFKLKFEVQKVAIYSNTNCIDSLLKPALTRIWLKRWYASVGRNNNILFAHLFANCQQRVFLLYTIMIRYKIRGKSSVWFTRTFFAEHYWRSKGIVFCSDVLHKISQISWNYQPYYESWKTGVTDFNQLFCIHLLNGIGLESRKCWKLVDKCRTCELVITSTKPDVSLFCLSRKNRLICVYLLMVWVRFISCIKIDLLMKCANTVLEDDRWICVTFYNFR